MFICTEKDGACGANGKVRQWMETVANSAVNDQDIEHDQNHQNIDEANGHESESSLSAASNINNNNTKKLLRSKRASSIIHHNLNNYNFNNHNHQQNNNNNDYRFNSAGAGSPYGRFFEPQGRISYNR